MEARPIFIVSMNGELCPHFLANTERALALIGLIPGQAPLDTETYAGILGMSLLALLLYVIINGVERHVAPISSRRNNSLRC